MSAQVVNLTERRQLRDALRQIQAMEQKLLLYRFESDAALAQRVARARLSELLLHHQHLLNLLREPLLEMIEMALLLQEDGDYAAALSLALLDNTHLRKLPELLAARRASLPAEHARLDAMGALPPEEPNT